MLENSRMTQTDQEIAGSERFFRSLLGRRKSSWDRISSRVHIRGRDELRFAPSLPLRAPDSTASRHRRLFRVLISRLVQTPAGKCTRKFSKTRVHRVPRKWRSRQRIQSGAKEGIWREEREDQRQKGRQMQSFQEVRRGISLRRRRAFRRDCCRSVASESLAVPIGTSSFHRVKVSGEFPVL